MCWVAVTKSKYKTLHFNQALLDRIKVKVGRRKRCWSKLTKPPPKDLFLVSINSKPLELYKWRAAWWCSVVINSMARKFILAQWSRATSVKADPIPNRRADFVTAIRLSQATLWKGSSDSSLKVTAMLPIIVPFWDLLISWSLGLMRSILLGRRLKFWPMYSATQNSHRGFDW